MMTNMMWLEGNLRTKKTGKRQMNIIKIGNGQGGGEIEIWPSPF
jgi:hypothetical protein